MQEVPQARLPKPVSIEQPGVMFFARHGQCRSNIEWPIPDYDHLKDPLSKLGEQQSRDCGRFLAAILPGVRLHIWSSELLRAIQTAEIIASYTDAVLAGRDERLDEISSNSEDHGSFLERIASAVRDITAHPLGQRDRHLIVTHGHVLECLVCQALQVPIRVVDKGGHGGQAGLTTHANGGLSAFYNGELMMWNAQFSTAVGSRPQGNP